MMRGVCDDRGHLRLRPAVEDPRAAAEEDKVGMEVVA
jgi:hypothetical protein